MDGCRRGELRFARGSHGSGPCPAPRAVRRIAAIVDFSSDAILSKSPDGTITSAERHGRAHARLPGRRGDRALDRDHRARGSPRRAARDGRAPRAAAALPPPETVRLTWDGRRIDVALTRSLIIDYTAARWSARPASGGTSSAGAPRRLRRSQAQLKDFVKRSALGLQWVGPDENILKANQACFSICWIRLREYFGAALQGLPRDQGAIGEMLEWLHRNEQAQRTARRACAARTARSDTCR